MGEQQEQTQVQEQEQESEQGASKDQSTKELLLGDCRVRVGSPLAFVGLCKMSSNDNDSDSFSSSIRAKKNNNQMMTTDNISGKLCTEKI